MGRQISHSQRVESLSSLVTSECRPLLHNHTPPSDHPRLLSARCTTDFPSLSARCTTDFPSLPRMEVSECRELHQVANLKCSTKSSVYLVLPPISSRYDSLFSTFDKLSRMYLHLFLRVHPLELDSFPSNESQRCDKTMQLSVFDLKILLYL